jgi:hypothetical protein
VQTSSFNLTTFLASVFSLLIGSLALLLSVLNYRRDRALVVVKLQWNAEAVHVRGASSPLKARLAHVYVTNEGRRPIFITFVGLELPGRRRTLNWMEEGKQLAEGSEPLIFKVPQDDMLKPFEGKWREIRAVSGDSADRWFTSKKSDERPVLTDGISMESGLLLRNLDLMPE